MLIKPPVDYFKKYVGNAGLLYEFNLGQRHTDKLTTLSNIKPKVIIFPIRKKGNSIVLHIVSGLLGVLTALIILSLIVKVK